MVRELLTLRWCGKVDRVPDFGLVEVTEARPISATIPTMRCVPVAPLRSISPLDRCLLHWKDWMRNHDDRDLGAKSPGGIRSGVDDGSEDDHDGYDDDAVAEAAIARMSREIAMATDVAIGALLPEFRQAIKIRCNLATKWTHDKLVFADVLPMAEATLIEKLSKNIATRIFW